MASAVAGTAALVMLGGRIAFTGQSAGMLQESAMFVDDFLAFARLAPPVTAPHERAGKPTGPAEGATIGKVVAQDLTFSYPGARPRVLAGLAAAVSAGSPNTCWRAGRTSAPCPAMPKSTLLDIALGPDSRRDDAVISWL